MRYERINTHTRARHHWIPILNEMKEEIDKKEIFYFPMCLSACRHCRNSVFVLRVCSVRQPCAKCNSLLGMITLKYCLLKRILMNKLRSRHTGGMVSMRRVKQSTRVCVCVLCLYFPGVTFAYNMAHCLARKHCVPFFVRSHLVCALIAYLKRNENRWIQNELKLLVPRCWDFNQLRETGRAREGDREIKIRLMRMGTSRLVFVFVFVYKRPLMHRYRGYKL